MEKRGKISEFDGIEFLKVRNQKHDFPQHYHDTFCISLIEEGLEAIKMGQNTLITEKGHISISNPYEIHANPIIKDSLTNSFTTIYLSPDVVYSFTKAKGITFCHQQLFNNSQVELFQAIVQKINTENTDELKKSLEGLLTGFDTQSKPALENIKNSNRKWTELMVLIDNCLEEKISLDFLAKFMNMNKFNFAKEFRAKFGLSPIHYVLMKKIFESKKMITKSTNLSQLAYQFDFTDLAHFSKHFKRFVGVSPQAYKKQLR